MDNVVKFGTPTADTLFYSLDKEYSLNGVLSELFTAIKFERGNQQGSTVLSAAEVTSSKVIHACPTQREADNFPHTELKFYIDDNRYDLLTNEFYSEVFTQTGQFHTGLSEESTIADISFFVWNEADIDKADILMTGIPLAPGRVRLSNVFAHYCQRLLNNIEVSKHPLLSILLPWTRKLEDKGGYVVGLGRNWEDSEQITFYVRFADTPFLAVISDSDYQPFMMKLTLHRDGINALHLALACTG